MQKVVDWLVTLLKWIGAVAVASMMFLIVADVIMRAMGSPIRGAVEVTGFLATVAMSCAMPYTHKLRGHVGVDMVVRKLSPRAQAAVDSVTASAAVVFFFIVAWRAFMYAETLKKSGQVSMTLEFPSYIFVHFIGFTFIVLALTILLDAVVSIKKAVRE